MLLKCSADMQKALNIKADKYEETDRLFSWCAHTVKTSRRNCVALMNCASKYNIVLWGLCAKDYEKLPYVLPEYIRQAMRNNHFSPEVIEKYIAEMGEIVICKNSNRSDVARLNKSVDCILDYSYYINDYDKEEICQSDATTWVNRRMLYSENGNYYYPVERFAELLRERYGLALYHVKMYHLKITLDFPDFEISREVLLPSDCSFETLHKVIQNSFNWQNYHLYEFTVGDSKQSELLITAPQEIEELVDMYGLSDEQLISDSECTLERVFEEHKQIIYTYDMGDCWEHTVELIETIVETESPKIKCLKVTGKAPPEDCGGAYGYRELLSQIKNNDRDAIAWVLSMQWKEQTESDVNFSLSYL